MLSGQPKPSWRQQRKRESNSLLSRFIVAERIWLYDLMDFKACAKTYELAAEIDEISDMQEVMAWLKAWLENTINRL